MPDMPALVPPGSGGVPSWGNGYESAFPAMGLAGLAQGFTHGLEIGHDWSTQARQQDLENQRAQNEAAWRQQQLSGMDDYRQTMLGDRAQREADMIDMRKMMIDAANKRAEADQALKGRGLDIAQQNADTKAAAGGKKGADVDEKALKAAAGAYSAMGSYQDLANSFLPDSTLGSMGKAPLEWIRSKAMQTSPENNLMDKAGQAATLYAAAVNAGGGGRMSEAEIDNMKKAMGGNGIGETKPNIAQKLDQMKADLAAKSGLTRQQIEDYLAKTKGGGVTNPTNVVSAPSKGGAAHIPSGRVVVVAPDGRQYHLPAEQLSEALRQGYRQP